MQFSGSAWRLRNWGRQFFQERGWYGDRLPLQATLSILVLVVVGTVIGGILHWGREFQPGCRLAIGGTIVVMHALPHCVHFNALLRRIIGVAIRTCGVGYNHARHGVRNDGLGRMAVPALAVCKKRGDILTRMFIHISDFSDWGT